jgi:hypothetical protein
MVLEVEVAPEVKDRPDAAALVESMTPALRDIIVEPRYPVRAVWDYDARDPKNAPYILRLEDFSGSVVERFTRDELLDPKERWGRIHWQWTGLLTNRLQSLATDLKRRAEELEDE